MPDAPHAHLLLAVRTAQRVAPDALLIVLAVGDGGDFTAQVQLGDRLESAGARAIGRSSIFSAGLAGWTNRSRKVNGPSIGEPMSPSRTATYYNSKPLAFVRVARICWARIRFLWF